MKYETIVALIDSFLEEKFLECKKEIENNFSVQPKRGPRGKPGRDFSFLDHQEDILNILSSEVDKRKDELTLKFKNLTDKEKEELKLKFDDLSHEDRMTLKGPRGVKGSSGKDFDFYENKDQIEKIITGFISSNQDSFKLKLSDLSHEDLKSISLNFEDLSEEHILSLKGERGDKGPRGQKGSQGPQGDKGEKGERGERGERGAYGPRGQRGKPGLQGERGDKGDQGVAGPMGPRGIPGVQGVSGVKGERGRDGLDAPFVVDVKVNEYKDNEISFSFIFNDGSEIETDQVKLPRVMGYLFSQMGGGGGGGGSPEDVFFEAFFQNVKIGDYNAVDFLSSYFNVSVTDNKLSIDLDLSSLEDAITDLDVRVSNLEVEAGCVEVFDEGNKITDCLKQLNFVGPNVVAENLTTMADWDTLADVEPSLSEYEAANPGNITVTIGESLEEVNTSAGSGTPGAADSVPLDSFISLKYFVAIKNVDTGAVYSFDMRIINQNNVLSSIITGKIGTMNVQVNPIVVGSDMELEIINNEPNDIETNIYRLTS